MGKPPTGHFQEKKVAVEKGTKVIPLRLVVRRAEKEWGGKKMGRRKLVGGKGRIPRR